MTRYDYSPYDDRTQMLREIEGYCQFHTRAGRAAPPRVP
jgi:hypothetical protein